MSWMTTKLATAAAPQNPSSNGVRAAESGRQYFQLGCITYEEVGPPNNVNCTFQPFCCNCLNPGSTLISAIPAAFVYSTHLLDSQLDFLVHWRNPAPSVQFPLLERRLSPEVRDVFEEQYDKLSLRCRNKLDVCDAEEIARMVVRKKDHELSRKLLKRLSQSEDLCKSCALSEIPWLLVDMEGQTGLVEPRSAWHQDVKDVLGLVRPIAEGPKSTLKLLQVKFEEDLDDNVLKEQHLG